MDAEEEEPLVPISIAVEEGDVDEVARLLDAEPHLLAERSAVGNATLLIWAACKERVGVVRLLVERGAEVSASDENGVTALHWAARDGNEEMVSILIDGGADVGSRNVKGCTPLIDAAIGGHLPVVQLLLQRMEGRGLDAEAEGGRTALCLACVLGHTEVVRALLLAGADHTIGDDQGRTPGEMAERYRRPRCMEIMEWWEDEHERAYWIHYARTLHDDAATRQQAPGAPLPAYLVARGKKKRAMPGVQILGRGSGGMRVTRGAAKRILDDGGEEIEKEKEAMLSYVVNELNAELYVELMATFHHSKS